MCACQTGRRDQYARSPISLTGAVDQLLTFILLTWTATVQRLEPVAGGGCTPADWHQAVDVQSDKQRPEWRLYEVLRSYGFRDPVGAAPPIVSPSSGLLVRP